MSKSYESYMPKRKEKRLVQAQVESDLHEKVKAILDKEGWTWHEFMNGIFAKFADDYKHTKKVG